MPDDGPRQRFETIVVWCFNLKALCLKPLSLVSCLRIGLRVVAIEFSTSSLWRRVLNFVCNDRLWTCLMMDLGRGSKRSSCDASILKPFVPYTEWLSASFGNSSSIELRERELFLFRFDSNCLLVCRSSSSLPDETLDRVETRRGNSFRYSPVLNRLSAALDRWDWLLVR